MLFGWLRAGLQPAFQKILWAENMFFDHPDTAVNDVYQHADVQQAADDMHGHVDPIECPRLESMISALILGPNHHSQLEQGKAQNQRKVKPTMRPQYLSTHQLIQTIPVARRQVMIVMQGVAEPGARSKHQGNDQKRDSLCDDARDDQGTGRVCCEACLESLEARFVFWHALADRQDRKSKMKATKRASQL